MAARRTAWLDLLGTLVLCGLAVGSCTESRQAAPDCASADLLVIAARQFRAHVPSETLKIGGGKISYFIQDEGDRWSVMVSPYQDLRDLKGHRMVMLIRKSDRQVSAIEVTPPRAEQGR